MRDVRQDWKGAHRFLRSNLVRDLTLERDYVEGRLLEGLRDAGFPAASVDLLILLGYLGNGCATVSELARRRREPIQTTARWIDRMSRAGYLSKRRCPDDQRMKHIAIAKLGVSVIKETTLIGTSVEREIACALGDRDFSEFKQLLTEARRCLGESYPLVDGYVEGRYPRPARVYAELHAITRHIKRRLFEAEKRDMSTGQFSASHWAVLRSVPVVGARAVRVSIASGLSRQRTSVLLRGLEAEGYLDLAPDPADARAHHVCFTSEGQGLVLARAKRLRELLCELQHALGDSRYERLAEQAGRARHLVRGSANRLAPRPNRDTRMRSLVGDWIEHLYSAAIEDPHIDVEEFFIAAKDGVRLQSQVLEELLREQLAIGLVRKE